MQTGSSTKKLVATVATLVTAATLAAGPAQASAQLLYGSKCPPEGCGGANHNEVMATTATS